MRITRRTAVIIAVVCAAGAALLSIIYLQSLAPKPAAQVQVVTTRVPVPAVALPAGSRITPDLLTSKEISRDALTSDIVTNPEELYNQKLSQDAPAGEPIPRSKLAAYSPQAGLSYVVPEGMRAVTVAVDNISGVSGFLKLGDRVDVLATFDTPQKVVTRTILQDVEILGLGTEGIAPQTQPAKGEATGKPGEEQEQPQGPATPRPSATLAVTPAQAQVLVLAANRGKLHLALRPKGDARMMPLPPTTNELVVGIPLTSPPPAPGAAAAETPQPALSPATPAGRAGAALGTEGTAPGAPGTTAISAPTRPKPGIEVYRGGEREIVTP